MPWLLWAFDRQSWPSKELIIIDSSTTAFQPNRRDVRVISAAPGTSVPAKRNLALAAATGELLAWFDDDDWQHPERLGILARALPKQAAFVGATRSWFVDLYTGRCRPYDGHGNVIFNSALFRREAVASIPFDARRRKASDTLWMRSIISKLGAGAAVRQRDLTLWLCHDANISNPRQSRAFSDEIASIKRALGAEAWGDTQRELELLRARLPATTQPAPWVHPLPSTTFPELADRAERRVHRLRQAGRRLAESAALRPSLDDALWEPFSAPGTLDARPADASAPPPVPTVSRAHRITSRRPPLHDAEVALVLRLGSAGPQALEPLVAHLVKQARWPFTQRLAFGGDESGPWSGFDDVVAPAEGSGRRGLLAALERVTSDYVLVAYAPLLFHSTHESWVARSVDRLKRDPSLLFVTHQCGPAAGPPGSPRSRPKSGGPARWDRHLQLWRQQRLASPAFVAARSQLVEALHATRSEVDDGLEHALGAALRAKCADCGSLTGNDGWALPIEGNVHAAAAVNLVAWAEAGAYPAHLLGRSSVLLDEPLLLAAWQRVASEAEHLGQHV